MASQQKKTDERAHLIDEVHRILGEHEYTERDAFHLIGCFAPTYPIIAGALAFHMRDAIQEVYDTAAQEAHAQAINDGLKEGDDIEYAVEVDYSTILAHVYERAFFDEETAAKYGTEAFAGDVATLTKFVQFLQTMADVNESGVDNIEPLHRLN